MERKLTLADFAGYSPYGLVIVNCLYPHKLKVANRLNNGINELLDFSDLYRPVLRPLSDLYRTITHNEKEIIPIVELAKICEPNIDWKFGNDIAVSGDYKIAFDYDEREGKECFFMLMINFGILTLALNQYRLFDCLHELKLDYRKLIDVHLAVSCYHLPENPYK